MESTFLQSAGEFGGTVFIVVAFIWYLRDRNGKQERAMGKVSDALDRVAQGQEKNTKVLIKVAMKHKLLDEADELIGE